MKKFFLVFMTCIAFGVFAQVDTSEETWVDKINIKMGALVDAINTSDGELLQSLIADSAPEYILSMPEKINAHTIRYTAYDRLYALINSDRVEATWKVTSESRGADGKNSLSGITHNAIFELQGGEWIIIDGDFDPTNIGDFDWLMFAILAGMFVLIFIPLGVLWVWMLIHAAKHDIDNKTTWIILMCLIGSPVAVIYFFTERKRFNRSKHSSMTTQAA